MVTYLVFVCDWIYWLKCWQTHAKHEESNSLLDQLTRRRQACPANATCYEDLSLHFPYLSEQTCLLIRSASRSVSQCTTTIATRPPDNDCRFAIVMQRATVHCNTILWRFRSLPDITNITIWSIQKSYCHSQTLWLTHALMQPELQAAMLIHVPCKSCTLIVALAPQLLLDRLLALLGLFRLSC